MTKFSLLLFFVLFSVGYASEKPPFRVETLLENRGVLWGFDFINIKEALLTERSGNLLLFHLDTKRVTNIPGTLEVFGEGQGGLLDVRVHPHFKINRWVYWTYSELKGSSATTALARGELRDGKLGNVKRIFSATALSRNEIHFGSRIEFDGAGHLFLSVGDRGERDKAQDLSAHNGKILRLMEDGSIPKDNPFVKRDHALPEIWSYGHRNPQGLAIHPKTRALWAGEFGPRGGDELNLIVKGKNYGWPIITYGTEYHGPKIGEGPKKLGMEQPIVYWVPSISPSGMTFYFGNAFPAWHGNLFLGCLSGQHMHRVALKANEVIEQEELLGDRHWRIRNVREGPDGDLYLSTDEGRFVRILPTGVGHRRKSTQPSHK